MASTVLLYFSGLIRISRKTMFCLLAAAVLAVSLIVAFIMIIPSFNCVLMKDHSIVEQPFVSENLTLRMTREAVDFIER